MTRRPIGELRSQRWFASDDMRGFAHRQRTQQMGLRREEFLGKPVVAIVNTWSDLSPCHSHLRDRAEAVKRGVWQAGGYPVELPALSVGEVMVKPTTMLYRNFLAMEVEELLRSHPIDGAVLLGGCDKSTPGLLMGAISMDIPVIYCPAGPMSNGQWRGQKTGAGTHTKKYWDELRAGNITQADWVDLESRMTRSIGTCNTMGTASTMTSIVDAMGLTLPGASSIPAADSGHPRMASACGERIVEMIWEDWKPSRFLDARSFRNGLVAYMALGGSTNAAVHLIAMARRAGVDLTLDDMSDMAGRVPVCANLFPSGEYLMEDFYFAGGLSGTAQEAGAASRSGCHDRERQDAGREHRRSRVLERRCHPGRGQSGRAALARQDAGRAARQSRPERRRDEILGGEPEIPQACRAGARLRQPGRDEPDHRRSRSRHHGGHGHRAAQCRSRRRAGHAGMGQSADPEEAPHARACATWSASATGA